MIEAAATHGSHHKGPVKPLPTVVPNPIDYVWATDNGFRTLWVVFVIMVVASAVFSLLSWRIPIQRRLYHVITTIITITAAVSYFAMATGHATTFSCRTVRDHHNHDIPDTFHEECREVFWARYVDWAITTPLLLLDLCLLAGVDGGHTLMAIVADEIMVLTGLFAAFGNDHTAQKWGWYTIGCIAYLFVIWHVGLHGASQVKARGQGARRLFTGLAGFTLILWTIYPVVWGIADGGRWANVNTEIISYAVLDVLAKPVFGLWLLTAHRKVPETNVEIGGYWAHGLTTEGRIRLDDGEDA